MNKQNIFVEFEANTESFEGEICVETQNALKEGLIDNNHENMYVYLVLSGRRSRLVATQDLDESPLMQRARSISIVQTVLNSFVRTAFPCLAGVSHALRFESLRH